MAEARGDLGARRVSTKTGATTTKGTRLRARRGLRPLSLQQPRHAPGAFTRASRPWLVGGKQPRGGSGFACRQAATPDQLPAMTRPTSPLALRSFAGRAARPFGRRPGVAGELYLKDIGKMRLLSAREEVDLAQRIRARRPCRQDQDGRVQPAPRGVDRQGLPQPGPAISRSHPRGHAGSRPRGREVRLA